LPLPLCPLPSIIDTMSFPLKLFRLQQIDTQLDQANNRLKEIEKAISENPLLDQASQVLQEAEKSLATQNKALIKAEDAVRAQRTKIEQTESTLYSGRITNPKELQDLQNETAALKRYLLVLEDRQLEVMIFYDEAHEKLQAALSHFEQLSIQVKQENQELLNEQGGIQKDIERISHEKQSLVNSLNTELMYLYEELRRNKRGIAVAIISDNMCTACGYSLTAALVQMAHSPNQITYCPSCGRVLYGG
jgi:predicted  nucleic acid-binding Zn-ribbon protein